MKSIEVSKVRAFTVDGNGGNAAGVVWPANNLSLSERQRVASEVGFSETAFVSKNPQGILEIEYYTPNRQIEICGHATVGAFSLLREREELTVGRYIFKSVIGEHEVEVRRDSVGLWQKKLESKTFWDEALVREVANSIGVKISDIVSPFRLASNGSAFLLIELTSIQTLSSSIPNQEEILRISEKLNLVGYYVFYRAKVDEVEVRMFAPRYGIPEESATGMGAGALALALGSEEEIKELRIRQGHLMAKPSPSLLLAELRSSDTVFVRGGAVIEAKGHHVELEE